MRHIRELRIILFVALSAFIAWSVATTYAYAAFDPAFEVNLMGENGGAVQADSVPLFTTIISKDAAEPLEMGAIKVTFPQGWKVNNVDSGLTTMCKKPDDVRDGDDFIRWFERKKLDLFGNQITEETHNNCPDSSIVGTVSAEVVIPGAPGIYKGKGHVYLLDSNPYEDPVKLGVFINVHLPDIGDQHIAKSVFGDVTLEGELLRERIVAVFKLLQIDITSINLQLTNQGGRGLIRTPVRCNRKSFFAEIISSNNPLGVDPLLVRKESETTVSKDCDFDKPTVPRKFEPTMPVTSTSNTAGGHGDLLLKLGGEMNSGSKGYESLSSLRLSLPQGMVGSLYPFERGNRCKADINADAWRNGEDPCELFIVGKVLAVVDAAQQRHTVRGLVYLSDPIDERDLAALRIVFPRPPKRLNSDGDFDTRDPLVLTAGVVLNSETNRVEVEIRELPKTYEIKQVVLYIPKLPEGTRPFLTNPTACSPRSFDETFTSDRSTTKQKSSAYQVTGCNILAFSPGFALDLVDPGPNRATEAEITVRQPEGQAHAKAARFLLAQGLRTNSELDGITPCHQADVSRCGANSVIGSVKANSPALAGAPFNAELQGDLHLLNTETGKPMKVATALTNDQLPGLKITQQGVIKMQRNGEGKFQIVSDLELPELPITDFKVSLAKKLLRNPWRCGRASLDSKADFTSYSGLSHTSSSSERLDGCGAALPYRPGLTFSPQTNVAGSPTTLTVGFNRAASDQTTRDIELKFPKGWSADVLTKPICSNADAGRSACPGNSRIGSVTASARIFKFLPRLDVNGDIYRCAPEGNDAAAACIDLILPEIAGEGHLRLKGRILVRNNAEQISVVVKDIPTEFDIELKMQIEGSTTPSFCSQNPAGAGFTGEAGTTVSSEAGYSSAACENLKYRPQLDFAFSTTKANAEPTITTEISQTAGDATTKDMKVTLPKGLRPNLASFAKGCSDTQWSARSCPTETKLGEMEVSTPLLNEPLKGPVYFGEGAKIYMQLDGLVPLAIEGRVTLSGQLGFEVTGLPPQPLRVATVQLRQGLFKNPSECETGAYKGEFTSHASHTATSAGSVGLCSGGKKNGLKLSAKLKPNTTKAYPKALFKITQERSQEKSISSFNIKLGKGAKARQLRFSTSRLARKGKARKQGSPIGSLSISPAKRGPAISGIVYGKNRRVKVKSDRRYLRKLSKKIKKAKSKKVKIRAKRDLTAVRRLQKTLQKKAQITVKGNVLKVRGLPNVKSKQISLRLNGRKYRLLRNPKKAGKVKLSGAFHLAGSATTKAETTVKITKRK